MNDTRPDRSLATTALASFGHHTGVELLAEGMSSAAWRGSVGGVPYVVRVPKDDGRRPTPRYEAEARLLTDLADRGAPVARATTVEIDGAICSVAPELDGRPVRPEQWTPRLLADLSAALGVVHETAPELAVESDVVARFHLARIWPFDGSTLADHPVAARWPDRAVRLDGLGDAITTVGAVAPTVVHTDLHWEHLLVDGDGRLRGILDFGDAFAGPAGWDFACLRYYHGDAVADAVIDHSADPAREREHARLLGIAFALYKLDKTPERLDVVHRVDRILGDSAPVS